MARGLARTSPDERGGHRSCHSGASTSFFQPRITASGRPQLDAFADAMLPLVSETIRAVAAAMGPLYAALSNEQERTADELLAEHSQDMRRRGP
jgi:hypothetical protein